LKSNELEKGIDSVFQNFVPKKCKVDWTPNRIELLKRAWFTGDRKKLLTAFPNNTLASLKAKARDLNLPLLGTGKTGKKYNIYVRRNCVWSKPNREKLEKVWKTGDIKTIERAFPKHKYNALRMQALRQGLNPLIMGKLIRRPTVWTKEKNKLLIKFWMTGRENLEKLLPDHRYNSISAQAYRLGLKRKRKSRITVKKLKCLAYKLGYKLTRRI